MTPRNPQIAEPLRSMLNSISAHVPAQAPSPEVMKRFHVTIKNGARIVDEFPVFGTSHRAVQEAHDCLCQPGEYCWVDDEEEMTARAGDRGRNNKKDADPHGRAEADRAQSLELQRMPGRGYAS